MEDPFEIIRELDGAEIDAVIKDLSDRLLAWKTLKAVRGVLGSKIPPEVPKDVVEVISDMVHGKTRNKNRINEAMAAIRANGGPMTTDAICKVINSSYSNTYQVLYNALHRGVVKKTEDGRWYTVSTTPNDEGEAA